MWFTFNRWTVSQYRPTNTNCRTTTWILLDVTGRCDAASTVSQYRPTNTNCRTTTWILLDVTGRCDSASTVSQYRPTNTNCRTTTWILLDDMDTVRSAKQLNLLNDLFNNTQNTFVLMVVFNSWTCGYKNKPDQPCSRQSLSHRVNGRMICLFFTSQHVLYFCLSL